MRRRIAAEMLAHSAMNSGRSLAMQLLVENRLQQRLERRRRCIKPQRELARPVNQRTQFGIVGLQMRNRLGSVERKFASPAVMDHRPTVYRVRLTAPDVPRPAARAPTDPTHNLHPAALP